MSPLLTWRVEARDGLTIVTVRGTVDTRSGPTLYRALAQCLRQEPRAVVVELSGASVTGPKAAGTFAGILDEARLWPGTPVLLCTPEATTAGVIAAAAGEPPPSYATVAEALSVLTRHNELVSRRLTPIAGAARRARDFVTEACVRWGVAQLTAPATLVASELVTNAVTHAHTTMTVQLALRPLDLFLAVIDGSPAEPVPRSDRRADAAGGRGLHLVGAAADRWGHRRHHDGKIVWARFRHHAEHTAE